MAIAADSSILALDVGDKRVGVAIASVVARLPRPLTTLERSDDFFDRLQQIMQTEQVNQLVVGLPRGLDGQETGQTAATEMFIADLQGQVDVPIDRQDEALTSQKAEAELAARSGNGTADVDSLAAAYILEDWLADHVQPPAREAA